MNLALFRPLRAPLTLLALTLILSGCGGGGGSADEAPQPPAVPVSKTEAARFLSQASYGANEAGINYVASVGYARWLNEQFNKPRRSLLAHVDKTIAEYAAAGGTATANTNDVWEAYWQQAIAGDDQLRARTAFALSQLLVISAADGDLSGRPRTMASFYDVLEANAFGNFRQLLNDVTLHPGMALYLTYMANRKESATRVPDENYAREIMQLFTIGLHQLNPDGSRKLDGSGNPIPTYTNEDVTGLAKVFTGWSWGGPDNSDARFSGSSTTRDPNRDVLPLQGYPKFFSSSEKKFLGVTIPARGTATLADMQADLKLALDTLFNHPNVGPFVGRQLIQRLVTSNPSPAYVQRVAAAFANNGSGVRGDMQAVLRAVLLDNEARDATIASNAQFGKLREPVIRLAHWARAFNATSKSGTFMIQNLNNPISQLGQTPMLSPSVFNFFRPGYVPGGTAIGARGLLAPELQITTEASVVGYLNYMNSAIRNGAGSNRDVLPDYTAEIALADDAAKLLERVDLLLTHGQMDAATREQILTALNAIVIPKPASNGSTTNVDNARKNRVYTAIFLTMASPNYLVQK